MSPDPQDEQLRKLLARYGLTSTARHLRGFFAIGSATVAAVTGTAMREPAASTLVWILAMLALQGLILYWLQNRYLRHLELLAVLRAGSDLRRRRKRSRRRGRKRGSKRR